MPFLFEVGVKRGSRRWIRRSARLPVVLTCHCPFPLGGNCCGVHVILFFLFSGEMLTPITLAAGSSACLSPIRIAMAGYTYSSANLLAVARAFDYKERCRSDFVCCEPLGNSCLFGMALLPQSVN